MALNPMVKKKKKNSMHSLNNKKKRGELTSVGMREHFVLGGTLRNKYIKDLHFLSETFNLSEMYVYSTD